MLEVCLIEAEPEDALGDGEENLDVQEVGVAVVRQPEFFGQGTEAFRLGAAPVRRRGRGDCRDDLAVDGVRELVIALAVILVDDDGLGARGDSPQHVRALSPRPNTVLQCCHPVTRPNDADPWRRRELRGI
jgi:hypothetical protein